MTEQTRAEQFIALAEWAEAQGEKTAEECREKDGALMRSIGGEDWEWAVFRASEPSSAPRSTIDRDALFFAPKYTTCLTTLTRVIGEELPEAMGTVHFGKSVFPASGGFVASLIIGEPEYMAEATTPAIALFAAFCRALASREAGHG